MSEKLIIPNIPEEEKTPVVLLLLEVIENQNIVIQQLRDEVARLKGNPIKPKLKPSKTIDIDKAERNKRSNNSKKKLLRRKKRKI